MSIFLGFFPYGDAPLETWNAGSVDISASVNLDDGCDFTVVVLTDGAYLDVEVTPYSFVAVMETGGTLTRVPVSQIPTFLQYQKMMKANGVNYRILQLSILYSSLIADFNIPSLTDLLKTAFTLTDTDLIQLNVSTIKFEKFTDNIQ